MLDNVLDWHLNYNVSNDVNNSNVSSNDRLTRQKNLKLLS